MHTRWLAWCVFVLTVLTLSALAMPNTVAAQAPDYEMPAGFGLPWANGQGQRVTWGPADHWSYGKARGIAYDFALQVGTPLYAPTNGWIYYLSDERPFETNYGHYVEIVSEDGDWLVRLAHLRDAQTGEGPVHAGELIGYAGMSGVAAAHLHVELLVRQGDAWVRPELVLLTHFFGSPIDVLTQDAIITNRDGEPELELVGGLIAPVSGALGEELPLQLTLRNASVAPLHLRTVQVVLQHEQGQSALAETKGEWLLGPKAELDLVVPAQLKRAGAWQVTSLTYLADEADGHLAAQASMTVTDSSIQLVGLELDPASCDTERPLIWRVTLANRTQTAQVLDGLLIEGRGPDGGSWRIGSDDVIMLEPDARQVVTLTASSLAQAAGVWQMTDVAYQQAGAWLYLPTAPRSFDVQGPQLQVQALDVFAGDHALYLLVTLGNVGTRATHPDLIEVWGWQPDHESSFAATQSIRTALQPGSAERYLLTVPTHDLAGVWRLVEAGAWHDGRYLALPLPIEPAIEVAQPALLSLLP